MLVRQDIRFAAVMLITLAGCAADALTGSSGQSEPLATGPEATETGLQIVTLADRSDARVGEAVKVWCLLKQGAEFFYPDAASVTITPEPTEAPETPHAQAAALAPTAGKP